MSPRKRGVFPLPFLPSEQFCPMTAGTTGAFEGSFHRGAGLSSKCLRRSRVRGHVNSWVQDMVTSLNEIFLGGEFADEKFSSSRVLASQRQCLSRFHDAVRQLGKPPSDISGPGALRELQGSCGYSGEPASLASFREDLISLPSVGGSPSSIETIVGPAAENILKVLRDRCRSRDAAAAAKGEVGLKAPYMDPVLKRSKSSYVKFLQRLHASQLIEFRTQAREHVGLFCIWKKSGRQRLIVDARLSNQWFDPPMKVELATGSSFTQIEVDPGPCIEVGGVDIADCFYNILLPEEFRDLFALPPVTASEAGVTVADGSEAHGSQIVFPVFRVIPMGFTHALWVCQQCHLEVVNSLKAIPESLRFVDGKPIPQMNPFIHTEYVDNFVALAQQPGIVAEAAALVGAEFQARGLPTHPVESGVGMDTLGWHFSESSPSVAVTPRRLWKLRFGVQELLKKGWSDGKTVEKIIGHLTFAALLRRELLSCFQACYVFVRKMYTKHCRLWPEVRRELRWAVSLLPLVQRNLSAEWSDEVFASDASLWGRGVVSSQRDRSLIREQGQYRDRWRFSRDEEQSVLHAPQVGPGTFSDLLDFEKSQAKAGDPRIPEVSLELLDGGWKVLSSQPWERREPIVILEGRALVWIVQHLARSCSNHGKRHLILTDSMSGVLSLTKGRGGTSASNRICRQVGALSLACDFDLHFRWIASELNPADAASRKRHCSRFDSSEGVSNLLSQDAPSWRSAGASWRYQAARFYRGQSSVDERGGDGELGVSGHHGHTRCQADSGQDETCEAWTQEEEGKNSPERAHLFGDQHDHSTKVDQLPASMGRVQPVLHETEAEVGHTDGVRRSSCSLLGSPVLRGGDFVQRHDSSGCDQIPSKRDSQVVSVDPVHEVYERVPTSGSTKGPGSLPFPSACDDCGAPDDGEEGSDGGSVADPDLGTLLQARRVPEVDVEADSGTNCSKQILVSPPVSIVTSRGKVPAKQDRRNGRVHSVRPSVPELVQQGSEEVKDREVSQQPNVFLQDSVRQSDVQRRCRRAWVSKNWDKLRVSGEAWFSFHRYAGQTPQHRGADEARPVEEPELSPSVRARRQTQPGVQQPDHTAARSYLESRKRLRQYHGPFCWLRFCPRRSVFLELFSGKGGISRAVKRHLGKYFTVVAIDIEKGSQHDLTKTHLQQFLISLIKQGLVAGVWIGTPCATWSRARRNDGRGPPPLRSDECLWGLPGLNAKDCERLQLGNALARFSVRVFRVCLQYEVAVALENPHTSRLWLIPSILQWFQKGNVGYVLTDYCQDDKPWRRRTRLMFAHVDLHHVGRLCSGKHGICSRSGNAHVQLIGQSGGQFLTLQAQPYPKKLCSRIACRFQHAIFDFLSRPISKLLITDGQMQ